MNLHYKSKARPLFGLKSCQKQLLTESELVVPVLCHVNLHLLDFTI